MRILVTDSYEAMSREAAKILAGQIWLWPDTVLGLATGSTPVGMYRELVRLHRDEGLDFSQVTSFNLDEYVGLGREDDQSYQAFMHKQLFDQVNIDVAKTHVPNGKAEDIGAECERYERSIREAGGIDLQVLGIGRNAHIGFNEPDDHFARQTHRVALKESTIRANSRFFEREADVPRYAISMGIGTILKARRILLLANGREKAQAVYDAVLGDITPEHPASILQFHPQAMLILDREAASLLPNV